jgi:3-dehydroquinate dehydratase type I
MNPSLDQKICVVVQGKTLNDFVDNLIRVQKQAAWVELRVDSLAQLDKNSLNTIRHHTIKPAIFCYRHITLPIQNQGVTWQSIYREADLLGFQLLDMDLCCHSLWANENWHTPRLISHHEFNNTPDDIQLNSLITQLRSYQTRYIKLATYAHTLEDVKRLIKVLCQKPEQEHWIIIGMGDAGKVLRIIGPYLGSYLSYAADGKAHSADGQYSYDVMCQLVKLLDGIQN